MLIEPLVSALTAEISRIMSLLVIKLVNFSFKKKRKKPTVFENQPPECPQHDSALIAKWASSLTRS